MATLYISPTGNDSTGTGTSGNPWLTVSKADSAAAAGDALICLAGNYTSWSSQTFVNLASITASGAVVFDGAAATFSWTLIPITISGITFRNATINFVASLSSSTPYAFVNCTFNNLVSGINTAFAGISAIIGNTNNGGVSVTAIWNITGCVFNNTQIGGTVTHAIIQIYVLAPSVSCTVNLTNCTFYSNLASTPSIFYLFGGGGPAVAHLTNSIIYNAAAGVAFDIIAGGTTSYTGSNNDFSGYSSPPSLSNQLSTDPLFVDATNSNFNLRPTSPCIGAGTVI